MADPDKQIAYLAAALKAPRIAESAARLAGQARDAGWTHEDYLIAVLDREVAARTASGAHLRIRAAGFPARKTLEEFVFNHQPGLRRDDISPLAAGAYLTQARNVVFLGPPGTGKTHIATALGIAACHAGHRVLFATATDWVARLQEAHRRGRLPPLRTRRRQLVLPTRLQPLRTRLADPHQQPALRPLGRRLRRPDRRRGNDRPDRSPRRRPHPQRRQLPAETLHRRHPGQRQTRQPDKLGPTTTWPSFRRAEPAHYSTSVDRPDRVVAPVPRTALSQASSQRPIQRSLNASNRQCRL